MILWHSLVEKGVARDAAGEHGDETDAAAPRGRDVRIPIADVYGFIAGYAQNLEYRIKSAWIRLTVVILTVAYSGKPLRIDRG